MPVPGLLAPFRPSADDPWDRARAAHLAARSGFGATPEEIDRLLALGPERAVETRLDWPGGADPLEARARELGAPLYEFPAEDEGRPPAIADARAWWSWRMCATPNPLEERLTLFWHAHFACQESDEIPLSLLLRQNRVLRAHAAGPFAVLLALVARDPAMLTFLDGRRNVRARPNENWARELMELFTLGVGCYTQRDVVEIARVFTGWGVSRPRDPEFRFHAELHDPSDKRVLGRVVRGRGGEEGVCEGDEVLAALLDGPAAAEFLARKLLRWFVEDDPAPELVEAAGARLAACGFHVREFLRELLRSQAFGAPSRRATLVKSPAGFLVSAVRALRVENPQLLALGDRLRELGMDLFHPPSVAGWELGPAWIHAGSVLLRARFAEQIAALPHSTRKVVGAPALDLEELGQGLRHTDALVRQLGARLVGRPLAEARVAELAERLEQRAPREGHARTRAAIALVVGSPEFALE